MSKENKCKKCFQKLDQKNQTYCEICGEYILKCIQAIREDIFSKDPKLEKYNNLLEDLNKFKEELGL